MNKETLQKIFNETYDEHMKQLVDENKLKETFSKYADESGKLNLADAMFWAYQESFERSTHFMWDVFKKIYELEETPDSEKSK